MSEKEVEEAFKELDRQLKIRKQRGAVGQITNVRLGCLKDFIPVHKLRNPERANKQAICAEIATPDGYIIKKAMILSSHPNSAIMKFLDRYQSWPRIGVEVKLKFDETSGFWRLDL